MSGVEKLLIKAGKDEVRGYLLVDQKGGGEVNRIEAAERMCRQRTCIEISIHRRSSIAMSERS